MKKNTTLLVLWASMLNAHAQLQLKQDVSPRQADLFLRSVSPSEFKEYVQKYGASRVREDGSISETGLTAVTSQTEYK